jgi:hypothetical protein
MLLARAERVVEQAEQRVEIGLVTAGHAQGEPVEHDRREAAELDRAHVVSKRSVRLAGAKPVDEEVALLRRLRGLALELRVVPEPRVRLEQHAQPVRALACHLAHRRVETRLGEERCVAPVDLEGELDEEVMLAGVVVDRVDETPESRGVLAGLRFLVRDPLLGPMLVVACVINLVAQGLIVAVNVLAYFHYGADPHVAGFLFGACGVGALLGAILAQQLSTKVDLLRLGAGAMVAMPLPLWLLSIAMPWGAAMVVLGAFAFFTPLINAPLLGILTTRTPAALRPKVMTSVMTVAMLAGPLGFFGAGLALAHVSVYLVLFVIAAAMTAGAVAFALTVLRRGAPRDVPVADVAHGQA